VRIHLVTQMWPGPEDPDLGSFLVPIRDELLRLGHDVEVTSIDHRRSARTKYARLSAESVAAARRFRPDVIFAHMLFPAGAAAAMASLASRTPLVVMAHGQDVANLGEIPGVLPATRAVVRRADGIIANSRWLADQLSVSIPAAREKTTIADCGIDLERFHPRDPASAREELGWAGPGPSFVCVGSLIERKNVIRLADAFAEQGAGRLAFVGDGPLRPRLEGRPGVDVVGRIPQADVPAWVAAADVLCQPSLREPFGQATLEGLAMARSVVATTIGGPPEFVTPESGVLVDPFDGPALADALRRAAEMPTPNPAAREAAAAHDVKVQVARMVEALERAAQRSRKR
jgi:glycosyltransferase involved in cell wall biosynthesis